MISWIASSISILGILLNANKNVWCWPVWILANVFWIYLAVVNVDYAQLTLWVAFTLSNIYGWMKWTK